MPLSTLLLVLLQVILLLHQECASQEISEPQPVDPGNIPSEVVEKTEASFAFLVDPFLEKANRVHSSKWLTSPLFVSATSQIVQGELYRVTLAVGESSCDYSTPIIQCTTDQLRLSSVSEAKYMCEVTVWYRPFSDGATYRGSQCVDEKDEDVALD